MAADKICTSAPLEHHEEKVELSGEAKAQLAGVLAKVVDLGINGAAKYTKGDSKGVI